MTTGNGERSQDKPANLLDKIGMHVPEGKRDRLHIQPRFFKFLGFLGVLFLIFSVGMFEFSTSPYFCASCHIMAPYYKAWKTSKHNHVPCVDCHYPPDVRDKMILKFQALSQVAKYVTRTYSSKPYAEISDESCLRKGCHETRLLQGVVTFKRGIRFDHTPHLTDMKRGKKLRCTSCHSQIVVGNHMEVTESTCFLCHFRGAVEGRNITPIGGCGEKCHKSPEKDIKFGSVTFNTRISSGRGTSRARTATSTRSRGRARRRRSGASSATTTRSASRASRTWTSCTSSTSPTRKSTACTATRRSSTR
jgi:hypothetical protein